MKKIRLISLVLCISLLATLFIGCENDAQTGALLGAAIGAGIGQATGHDTQSTLIGGAIGGGAGYMIGSASDKNKQQQTYYQPSQPQVQTTTLWVTNSNGSKTPVNLTRSGTGWTGPKGEYYDTLPTQQQLAQAYGF